MFEPGRDAPADADADIAGRELGEPARGFHLGRVTDTRIEQQWQRGGLPPNGFEAISNPLPDTAPRLVRLYLTLFDPSLAWANLKIDVVGQFLGMQVKKRGELVPRPAPPSSCSFSL